MKILIEMLDQRLLASCQRHEAGFTAGGELRDGQDDQILRHYTEPNYPDETETFMVRKLMIYIRDNVKIVDVFDNLDDDF